ncbi:hypothetical protein ANAPC5_01474 [Anaplasma phagocytophilum]|nr:hypothetical protein ANAPC5_01474 [Anaplasma phagocytophilum]
MKGRLVTEILIVYMTLIHSFITSPVAVRGWSTQTRADEAEKRRKVTAHSIRSIGLVDDSTRTKKA